MAWLIGAFHPTGPYPVLAVHGEKGSAKSALTRYLRSVIDPNKAMAPEQPRDSQDLAIKAEHNWIVACDNMSSMPRWLSDGLCRLSTGASSSKRALYENTAEIVLTAKRPSILNGIEELATAGDLLDRTMIVSLPTIPEHRRKSEAELDEEFEEYQPKILGALLDAVVMALAKRDSVRLKKLPRLADFALWVTAAEEALGWEPGTFMEAYLGNREDANRLEIEASAVANSVLKFAVEQREWKGTATQLREILAKYTDQDTIHSRRWPADGKALSGQLKRHAGALRAQGVEVTWSKSGTRTITVRYVGKEVPETNGGPVRDERRALDDVDDVLHRSDPYSMKEKREEETDKVHKSSSGAPRASRHVCCECGQTYFERDMVAVEDDWCCFACESVLRSGVDLRQNFTAEDAMCEYPDEHRSRWQVFRDGERYHASCPAPECCAF